MKACFKIFAVLGLTFSAVAHAESRQDVVVHYADIAHAIYEDSLTSALSLQQSVYRLIARPRDKNLALARAAWIAARVPYQQSEVYRFGNKVVDDWEGKVNAWPLDEGLIDYVAGSYGDGSDENPFYAANVIANKVVMLSGRKIDASVITKALLTDTLHEVGEIEANVATGYHSIEFLLWGQDLNGTGPGAGDRPASDFDPNNCSNGNCERRAAYLKAATDLLIDDLRWMVDQWGPAGLGRSDLLGKGTSAGLSTMLAGMGSLSYGELAGERMKLGLMLHDPEEEHDCFSDNTHNSHYYNALGVQNIFTGSYKRIDGRILKGPSLSGLLAGSAPDLNKELGNRLNATIEAMLAIVSAAEGGEAYDQMLAMGYDLGNKRVQKAIDALMAQTQSIEKAVAVLGLTRIQFEGSDSLDHPADVFK
ncbi:MAG: peptidase [Rhodospirillaceae bacterium]|nr:peptidase [Rhodospirillaceae bacterium]|tara:strand:- start:3335 stop:4597 length:1263 start_codon:yes stop_codon:yes gene_type:complete